MSYGYNGDPYNGFNANNPFLAMLAAVEGEQEPQNPPPVMVNQQQQQLAETRVKLPDFWPHAPGIWFARAELRFETSNVASERQHFAYTVDALPYEMLCHVVDLVEAPQTVQPYTVLKERLLMVHQLMPVEKAIKLREQHALGDRRLSQLLANLLQACPPGEQQTAFFRGAFISRHPAGQKQYQWRTLQQKGVLTALWRAGCPDLACRSWLPPIGALSSRLPRGRA
jgi:hypothetical protein